MSRAKTSGGVSANTREYQARETGAVRESINTKIDTSLVPYDFICAVAVGLNYGAAGKYPARNWERGLNLSDLLNSVDRHTRALMAGEHVDHSSQLPHHILLASSAAMLVASIMRGIAHYDLPTPVTGFTVEEMSKMAQSLFEQCAHPASESR